MAGGGRGTEKKYFLISDLLLFFPNGMEPSESTLNKLLPKKTNYFFKPIILKVLLKSKDQRVPGNEIYFWHISLTFIRTDVQEREYGTNKSQL